MGESYCYQNQYCVDDGEHPPCCCDLAGRRLSQQISVALDRQNHEDYDHQLLEINLSMSISGF